MTAHTLIAQLGWVLLHFLWQGALIGCATALALLALRRARPEPRYAVACAGLLLCLAWPAAELVLRLSGGSDTAALAAPPGALGAIGASGRGEGWLGTVQDNLHLIVGAWACCAAALGLRLALGLAWVRRTAGRQRTDAGWQARLSAMAGRLDIERAVRLRIVDNLASPVTAGWLKPVVLVPAALLSGMPPQLLEALLAHELAHVRRGDYLVNLAQSVIETVLFYHPAVWWISGRIRVEREQIADDIAARQLGEPRRLALALSELERLQFSGPHLAQAANGGDLMARIKRLVRPDRPDVQAFGWKAALPALALALSMALACLAGAQTAVAAGSRAPGAGNTSHGPVADFNTCRKPEYPAGALARRSVGTVTVAYLVGIDGSVKDSAIRRSSGDKSLDEAARVAIAKCVFKPAVARGTPLEQWAKVQYVWSLD